MGVPIEGICPFFQRYARNRDGGARIYCDCAVVRCPDASYRRKMLYGYCAHPSDWQQCQFYRLMESCYAGGRTGRSDGKKRGDNQPPSI